MADATVRFLARLFSIAPPGSALQITSWLSSEARRALGREDGRGSRWDAYPLVSGFPGHLRSNLKMVLGFAATHPGTSLFFAPAPRDCPGRTSADAPHFLALIADVDFRAPGDEEQLERVLCVLEACDLVPSAVIDSGHGRHLYFFLDRPEPSHGSPSRARVLMARLQRFLGSDAVHDPARLMRLPGSTNWKGGVPKLVTLLEFAPKRRHSLDEVEAALDRVGAGPCVSPAILGRAVSGHAMSLGGRSAGCAPPGRAPADVSPRPPDYVETAKRLAELLPPRLAQWLADGHSPECNLPSQSELDVLLAGELLRRGASTDDVFVALAQRDAAHFSKHGATYFEQTVLLASAPARDGVRCQAFIERSKAGGRDDRDWVRLLLTSGPHDGERVDVRSYVDNPNHPWWLQSLRTACGISIPSSCVEDLRGLSLTVDVRVERTLRTPGADAREPSRSVLLIVGGDLGRSSARERLVVDAFVAPSLSRRRSRNR